MTIRDRIGRRLVGASNRSVMLLKPEEIVRKERKEGLKLAKTVKERLVNR